MSSQVEALEREIREKKQALAELRRQHSRPTKDYDFVDSTGKPVKLSGLFGKKDDLIVVHNMGTTCPYCTMWADGFNGLYDHLRDRAGFVLISNDAPEVQRKFAASRGWRFPVVSAKGTSFFADFGFGEKGDFHPGVSTFARRGAEIHHVARAGFGPGDDYCATWSLFDLLENGAGDWKAKFSYGA